MRKKNFFLRKVKKSKRYAPTFSHSLKFSAKKKNFKFSLTKNTPSTLYTPPPILSLKSFILSQIYTHEPRNTKPITYNWLSFRQREKGLNLDFSIFTLDPFSLSLSLPLHFLKFMIRNLKRGWIWILEEWELRWWWF